MAYQIFNIKGVKLICLRIIKNLWCIFLMFLKRVMLRLLLLFLFWKNVKIVLLFWMLKLKLVKLIKLELIWLI